MILLRLPVDQSMNQKAVVARSALNRKQIAWPDGGKHARSPCFQAHGTAAAENLGGKIKLKVFASFQREWRRRVQTTSSSAWHGRKSLWVGLCRRTTP